MDTLFSNLGYLMQGAVQTIWLAVVAIVCGTVIGLILGPIAIFGSRVVTGLIALYVFVLRGIPVLVVMFVFYYAFPAMGLRVGAYGAVGIALIVYAGAFFTEVVRGALASVPRGQIEAGRSLGMSTRQVLFELMFPIALPLGAPTWLNFSVVLVKSTAYASIVGAWELTYAARETVERTLEPFSIFGGVMVMYFIICYPLSLWSRRLESVNHKSRGVN